MAASGPNSSLFETKLLLYITKSVCRPPFNFFRAVTAVTRTETSKSIHLSFWLDLLNKRSLYVLHEHLLLNLICYVY